ESTLCIRRALRPGQKTFELVTEEIADSCCEFGLERLNGMMRRLHSRIDRTQAREPGNIAQVTRQFASLAETGGYSLETKAVLRKGNCPQPGNNLIPEIHAY